MKLKLQYVLARGYELTTYGSALLLSCFVGWKLLPHLDFLLDVSFAFSFCCAVIIVFPLGWMLGAIFFWPIIGSIVDLLNGAPFQEGDIVRILIGPQRNQIVRVYEPWPTRHQLRVELDEQSKQNVTDVFSYHEVRKERSV